MKSITGLYKKANCPLNKLKLRSILSFFTIGIFIFFGFASIEETPTLDCEFYNQPFFNSQSITIEIYDKQTKDSIVDHSMQLDIHEYEKMVNSNFSCLLEFKKVYSKTLNFGSSGKATFTLNRRYVSNDDLTFIYLTFQKAGYQTDYNNITIKPTDSNIRERFGYFKKVDYP